MKDICLDSYLLYKFCLFVMNVLLFVFWIGFVVAILLSYDKVNSLLENNFVPVIFLLYFFFFSGKVLLRYYYGNLEEGVWAKKITAFLRKKEK